MRMAFNVLQQVVVQAAQLEVSQDKVLIQMVILGEVLEDPQAWGQEVQVVILIVIVGAMVGQEQAEAEADHLDLVQMTLKLVPG
jgi:hypothetical protein